MPPEPTRSEQEHTRSYRLDPSLHQRLTENQALRLSTRAGRQTDSSGTALPEISG